MGSAGIAQLVEHHGYSMDIYPLHVYSGSLECSGFGPQGQGFTFNLMSATVVDQTATFLNITGTGIIMADGFDDTPMTWAFTVQNAGGNHDFFSFSANSATGVPDGGSAVALLGMGLGVIEFIRRRVRLRA
jgi:hypothetical protein